MTLPGVDDLEPAVKRLSATLPRKRPRSLTAGSTRVVFRLVVEPLAAAALPAEAPGGVPATGAQHRRCWNGGGRAAVPVTVATAA
jgi:hypothetical protein